jgi:septum formation topological specificity factor MinE
MERFALNRRDDGNDESANESDGMKMTKMTMTMTTGGSKGVGSAALSTMPGEQRTKGESFRILCKKGVCGESQEVYIHLTMSALLTFELSYREERVEDNVELERLQRDAVEVESRYLDADEDHLGLELLRGDRNRSSFGRIIQAPRKKKGHVLIDCCTAPGRIVTHLIPKSMSKAAPGVYSAARKSRWGAFG